MVWPAGKNRRIPFTRLVVPHDVHTHLMPGVDDGSFTPATAAATLTKMHRAGVRRVSLTPHVMAGVWNNTVVALRTTMSSFVRTLPAGDIPELHLGAEYMIDESLLQVADSGAELLTLPGGRVLVEMSYWGVSPQLGEIVTKLTDRGLVPVLAHPERYFYMADDLVAFDRLREAGCGFQLDMLAATGEGKGSPRIVNHLLARGMYTHVGSDIHTPRHLDTILDATIDEKTAEAGEIASLWWIK